MNRDCSISFCPKLTAAWRNGVAAILLIVSVAKETDDKTVDDKTVIVDAGRRFIADAIDLESDGKVPTIA